MDNILIKRNEESRDILSVINLMDVYIVVVAELPYLALKFNNQIIYLINKLLCELVSTILQPNIYAAFNLCWANLLYL
jgi:hypothetical protein